MLKFGYALSSEEHGPSDLVRYAQQAEAAGCEFALVSDHYHPWVDAQGQSPFVWCVIGGIAERTKRLRLGTGVTCPHMRLHPAIIAQAAATAAAMMPGRFFLGVGAGENLNEHILGDQWPAPAERLERLEEAIQIIRGLWRGEVYSHRGTHHVVEEARLYTLPDELPPICIAADGERAASLAGRLGDGLIGVAPKKELVESFESESDGGAERPRYGQISVCWGTDEKEALRTAHHYWPTSGLGGSLSWEIKTPKQFEDAVKTVREEDIAKSIVCGPDVERYLEQVQKFEDAGFDHIYFHQVGPDQHGFLRFFAETLAPQLASAGKTDRPARHGRGR